MGGVYTCRDCGVEIEGLTKARNHVNQFNHTMGGSGMTHREYRIDQSRYKSAYAKPDTTPVGKRNHEEAAYGFHGYINHPTYFLAGEKGRERVDIYKTQKKHHGKKHNENFWNVSEYFEGRF